MKYIILIIIAVIAFIAIGTFAFMLLWNWLMPMIFGLPEISFWMALGISILFNAIFKPHVNINKN